jgi:hypothetical protein
MRALLERLGLFQRNVRFCETTRYLFDDGSWVHRLAPFDVNPGNPHPSLAHFAAHLARAVRTADWSAADSLRLVRALPKLTAMSSFAHEQHYDAWDNLSVEEMFAWIGLPQQLEEAFKSMCKASTFHAHSEISASWGLSMVQSTMIGHPDDHKMWCFRGNLGTHLVDPLADALRDRGGRIVRNATAVGVERDRGGRIVGVLVAPTDRRSRQEREVLRAPQRLACDAVVAATDIPGFQRWLLPALADVAEIRATANLMQWAVSVPAWSARARCATPTRRWESSPGSSPYSTRTSVFRATRTNSSTSALVPAAK